MCVLYDFYFYNTLRQEMGSSYGDAGSKGFEVVLLSMLDAPKIP